VKLTATPASGWHLARWTGAGDGTGSAATVEITMDATKTVTVVFEKDAPQYTLTVTGQGQGSFTPASGGSYNAGTLISLTATPVAGWVFDHWSGDLTGNTNPATVTMEASKTITGVFIEQVGLTITVTGSGTVAKSPSADKYNINSTVTLTATPASGWNFDHWEGDATGSTNPLTVTLNSSKAAKAVFVVINQHPIVKMETAVGTFRIELDREKAPITVDNFLRYAKEGFYDGADGKLNGQKTIFHRVIKDFMIQGGGFVATEFDQVGMSNMQEKTAYDPIVNEASNGLKNVRGTIAMARTDKPDTATSEFFINVVDNTHLDYVAGSVVGYAVFGHVIEGMDIVDNINKVQTRTIKIDGYDVGDVPLVPIFISKVTVE
jgi:cyclophilin family peptidyl-prolyl cis-trans isomerase